MSTNDTREGEKKTESSGIFGFSSLSIINQQREDAAM